MPHKGSQFIPVFAFLVVSTIALGVCPSNISYAQSAADKSQPPPISVDEPPAKIPSDDDFLEQKVFNAKETTLKNGLRVVVVENPKQSFVTQMLWVKAGAADEPQGVSGIAHFLEHLAFKGSPVIGQDEPLYAGEFSKIIKSFGGQDNAFTSQDYTAYFQSVPAAQLPRIMAMEAGRLKSMTLPAEEVASERKVILEERSQRTDNNPAALFNESLNAALFPAHPYGVPIIGWRTEMEQLTKKDALNFLQTHYRPSNAILVLTGGIKAQAAFKLAEEFYGGLTNPRKNTPANDKAPSNNATAGQPSTENANAGNASANSALDKEPVRNDITKSDLNFQPKLSGRTDILMSDPRQREPMARILFTAPSVAADETAALSLQLLSEIIGGGPSSRLYRNLVIDQKVATSAGAFYDPYARGPAVFGFYAAPAEGVAPQMLTDKIEEQLKNVLANGVTANELRDAKDRLQASSIYALDSLSGAAMILGQALTTETPLESIEYWPKQLEAITAQDISAAATQSLNINAPNLRYVRGVLLPEKALNAPVAPSKEKERGDE